MGLPPPNYSKDSLLPEPVAKKTVLPVQGGGGRILGTGEASARSYGLGTGEASTIPDEKELLIQCHDKALKLHYVKDDKLAEPLGDDVKYSNGGDDDFEGIEKKSIMYSWIIGSECFDKYVTTVLNTTGEYMKDGGIIAFVDYTPDMINNLDMLKGVIAEKEKEIPLTHKWDISIVKASDFPFLLGYNTGDEDKIPTHLMLFKLLGGEEEKEEPITETVAVAEEPTIKLTVGFRVRNPEKAKENIRELSFTPGEELLFKRLGFDKPFIRKYITLPDGTKEESDASKDAFFKFWKTYVLMDGTSQFSLMTKGESQKVQQYMRDILDAYRKYLSESALQLLFHTSGKPYEPVSEDVSTDQFVFTKAAKAAKADAIDYKKISAAVKILIETVAAAKELDFKAHRISIAKAIDTRIKGEYEVLKKDVEKLVEQAKKAIDAGKDASIDVEETSKALVVLEGFKFTETGNSDDFINGANNLISLANKLVKKLEDLEKEAREFAIIIELEGNSGSTYEPSENGEEEEEEEEEDEDDGEFTENNDASNAGSLETARPTNPLTEEDRELKKINHELNKLLLSLDKIIKKGLEYKKTISEIIVALSISLPDDDNGAKLRKFMGNPPKTKGLYIDATQPKIAPVTFIRDYLVEKGKDEKEPNKRMTWIINNLIKLDMRRLDSVKGELIQFFKSRVLLRDITGNRIRILAFIDKHATP